MPAMTIRNVSIMMILFSFPVLIAILYFSGADLGLWMGGWFVAALVYLVLFEAIVNSMRREKQVHERYPRSGSTPD